MDKYLELQGFYTHMAIVSVNPGDTITAQKYNEIQAQMAAVLGRNPDGYGYTPSSIPVTPNDIIKAEHYARLYNDIRRCRVHQAGSAVTLPGSIVAPVSGDTIFAAYTNNLITAVDQVLNNRYAAESGQLNSFASPQSLTPFNTSYVHTVTYEWDTADDIRYFFNLGGRITAQIGTVGSPSSPLDSTWVAAVATANAAMQSYGRSDFASSAVGVTKTLYTNGGGTDPILVTVEQISGKKLELKFQMTPNAPLTIGITSQGAYFYSRGDLGGVASPLASVVATLNSGAPIVVTPTTRTLTVTAANNDFAFSNGGTSDPKTYTLTNTGNAALTVTGITFSNATGITATPAYSWSFPLTLAAGDTRTFTLTYGGSPGAATWTSSFTVASSNNDAGNITIQTRQIVSAPAAAAFTFSIDPTFWSAVADNAVPVSRQIVITPSASYNSYTAAWQGVPPAGFSFTLTNGGPTVAFDPTTPGVTNGTYSAVLDITIQDPNYGNLVVRSSAVSITRSIFETRNLGTWLGPMSANNAVIGASYDIINNNRYLTLGVTMGADGSVPLANGGIPFADANNLSFTADDNYLGGPVLYPALDYSSGWPSLLRPPSAGGYGVWPISLETMAAYGVNGYNTRDFQFIPLNYTINCPANDTYTVEFGLGVDFGYCTIDGNLVVDLRFSAGDYAVGSGNIFLTAGTHTLTIYYSHYIPNVFGLRITGSGGGEIWSTRSPIRAAAPFRYWSEVYRIPIYANGTVMVHQSANYLLKATRLIGEGQRGYTWGTYCGVNERAGHMFTVTDDGAGNVTVDLNGLRVTPGDGGANQTLIALASAAQEYDSFMYWVRPFAINRFRNLEDQNPNNPNVSTRFRGFNRSGQVITVQANNYIDPGPADNTYVYTGGEGPGIGGIG